MPYVGRYCEGGEQCLQTSSTFLCFTQKLLCGCPSAVSWLQHWQELGKLDHPNVFEIVETFKKKQEVHGKACCWSCTSSSSGRSFRETASAPKNQGSKIKPARSNRHKTQQSLRHYTCTTCTTNIEFQCFAHN